MNQIEHNKNGIHERINKYFVVFLKRNYMSPYLCTFATIIRMTTFILTCILVVMDIWSLIMVVFLLLPQKYDGCDYGYHYDYYDDSDDDNFKMVLY